MGEFLIIVALVLLLFMFTWWLLARPIVKAVVRPDGAPLPYDPTSVDEMKAHRAILTEKKAKLRNKRQLAEIDAEINTVNKHLADLA